MDCMYVVYVYIHIRYIYQHVLYGLSCMSTAYCIGSVIFPFSNLNWWSSSPGLFSHVPLKRDQGDWDWRLRFNDNPNAIGCTNMGYYVYTHVCMCIKMAYYVYTNVYIYIYVYIYVNQYSPYHIYTHVCISTRWKIALPVSSIIRIPLLPHIVWPLMYTY